MDLFVSPSEEETFGLAALEAAAAGSRVVAAECPALDGLQAPNVRRIARSDARRLRSILLDERTRFFSNDNPRPASPQGDLRTRYDIRSVAARIDVLYESLLGRS
jgi:glycosyltransferase involved in cell wall biosynthesis